MIEGLIAELHQMRTLFQRNQHLPNLMRDKHAVVVRAFARAIKTANANDEIAADNTNEL